MTIVTHCVTFYWQELLA